MICLFGILVLPEKVREGSTLSLIRVDAFGFSHALPPRLTEKGTLWPAPR
jgi:hypothetical protein